MEISFTPADSEPERDAPDHEDSECHCENADNQYVMKVDSGSVYFRHAACGKPPGSWADDSFFMPTTPVTMTWNFSTDYWTGEVDAYGDIAINGLHTPRPGEPERVVICGSTRYTAEMAAIEQLLIWRGVAAFAPTACDLKSPNPLWDDPAERDAGAQRLADLHAAMIRDAHWVLVVGPYAGDSTRGEIAHAQALGKTVRFTAPVLAAEFDCEVWDPAGVGQATA